METRAVNTPRMEEVRFKVFGCLFTDLALDRGLQHEPLYEPFFFTTWLKIHHDLQDVMNLHGIRRTITCSKRKSNKPVRNAISFNEATKRPQRSRSKRFLEQEDTPGQLSQFGWKSKEDNHRSEGRA